MLTPVGGILVAVEVLSGKYLGAQKPHIIYRVTRNGIIIGLIYVAMYRPVEGGVVVIGALPSHRGGLGAHGVRKGGGDGRAEKIGPVLHSQRTSFASPLKGSGHEQPQQGMRGAK